MKKFNAISILETVLILAVVTVISYFGWQAIKNKSINLVGLSKINMSKAYDMSGIVSSLTEKLDKLMASLTDNTARSTRQAYIEKRVETTGVIGQLIVAYNSARVTGSPYAGDLRNAAFDALKELALMDMNTTSNNANNSQIEKATKTANACIDAPDQCTTLMTIKTTKAEPLTNNQSVCQNGECTIAFNDYEFNFSFKYINANGEVETRDRELKIYISDQMIKELTNTNGDSATIIQDLLNKYVKEDEGQYYVFETDETFQCKNAMSGGSCSVLKDSRRN